MCEIISGVILAEIVKSNHSSTLGVATLGESIVFFSGVLAEVQIPRQSSPISITSIYKSVFCLHTSVSREAMSQFSNLKYTDPFHIHGSTVISMVIAV